jgi:hypothetical protein
MSEHQTMGAVHLAAEAAFGAGYSKKQMADFVCGLTRFLELAKDWPDVDAAELHQRVGGLRIVLGDNIITAPAFAIEKAAVMGIGPIFSITICGWCHRSNGHDHDCPNKDSVTA